MSNITTDRAVKKAYFSDLSGGHIIEFQFSPHQLDFSEGGNYADRVVTGNYFTDLVWISGRPNKFTVQLFIDRTQESYFVDNFNQDPFSEISRFPNRNPKYLNFDVVNLAKGIARGGTSSGFESSFKKGYEGEGNKVEPSTYSASPHYRQTSFDENVGVLKDLEALMYYVRPEGLNLAEATFKADGSVGIKDFSQQRFMPPPMVRFYYGAIWREGYMINVDYNLSVMNKQLVPKRLDANIEIACTRWGYLNDVKPQETNTSLVEPINSNNDNFDAYDFK
jgi:hypothetical protein